MRRDPPYARVVEPDMDTKLHTLARRPHARLRDLTALLREWLTDHTCPHRWHAHPGDMWRCCTCGADSIRRPRLRGRATYCVCPKGQPAAGTIRPGEIPARVPAAL